MSSWVSGRIFMRRMSPRETHHRRLADLEMKVGRLMLHDHAEELVDLRLLARRFFRRGAELGFDRVVRVGRGDGRSVERKRRDGSIVP